MLVRHKFTILLTATCLALLAQDGPVRGARPAVPPNPLGQPLIDSPGHVREDAFIHIPLRPEDARYKDIDGVPPGGNREA